MAFTEWYEIAIAIFVLVFAFLFSGVPVAVALGAVGLLSTHLFLDRGGVVAYAAWNVSNNFILGAIPLFIFMGQLLLHSGISRRIFEGSSALVGGARGGLLQTNIVASGFFSAITGSSVATAATVGAMAIPELESRGYDSRITKGSLAAGGTLGILIPPSTALIIYGVIVEESIGDLFVAGILPGIMLASLFIAYIWLRAWLKPEIAPAYTPMPVRQRLRDIVKMWPVFLIMFVIIAGIYLGVMTPAEAAAMGAALALLFVLVFRQFTWAVLRESLLGTVKATSMLIFIMINASIVSGVLALAHIPDQLADWVLSLDVPALMIFIIICIMYVILGLFIDTVSMIVMTLPIVFPIIVSLGHDPIWFGIVVVILIEMGMITPPVGLNIYTIHGIRPEQPLSEVIMGSLPFVVIMAIAIVVLTVFPSIATFLPSTIAR